ncbi:Polycystic kidney disease 2-like 1 protein [Phytophthora citrophthora]|uniref:Polycystic kidney disease 2-like 1 protein n=1 Tax=Phytophthora citrophthora TaxID=4793 RepID=A0AAD9LC76_9STRA|nr:Polycystic kidney disease 2-like 1 protein [Phytophthora citrophthora]
MKKLVPGSMTPTEAKTNAAVCPLTVPLQAAYDVLCHDRMIVSAVWRIPVPVLYFCAFVSMLFAHIPSTNMYDQGYAVSSTLATSGSDTVTKDSSVKFYNIGDISDVFDWLTDTFVPSVFITDDYNGKALARDQWGRVASFNKVLGAVNFQVTRKAVHECITQPFLANLYPNCYDESDTKTEQRLISFDANATEAAGKITALKAAGNWLDFSTAELLITIVTYNGELEGYAVTEMILAFSEGGSVQTSSSTTPALSNPYSASVTTAADVVVLVFFLSALASQLRRMHRHRRTGLRNVICGDIWVVIEHASTAAVVAFYVVWFSIVLLMFQKEFRNNLASLVVGGKNWAVDTEARDRLYAVINMLKAVAKLTVALRLIATLAIFLLSLRILKRFRFHPRLSILTRTVANALHQFGAFFVVFIVIFVTFAVSGTILFGDRVEGFSSLETAMETCINMLFGNFDYTSIQGLFAPVCMFYYWGYMIVVSLVLLNMMLAIVLDAYAEVSSESYKMSNSKGLTVTRIAENMLWSFLLRVNDCTRWRRNGSAKTAPRMKGTSHLNFNELGRKDAVFRGRIRCGLLECGLSAMLKQKPSAALTSSVLMEMFPSAGIQESEARATLEHIIDGFSSEETPAQREEAESDGEAVVNPAPETLGPTTADTSVDLGRLAAQLAALEQKLDLLLGQKVLRGC